MTEPAFVGEGFIREEMFAQRSRSRLSTQEVKRIVGRKTHLKKGERASWGEWGGGVAGRYFTVVGVGMRECAVREGAEITKEPTRASPDTNRQASAIE